MLSKTKYIIFFLCAFLFLTCSKVSRKKPELIGKWISNSWGPCSYFYLEITQNNAGLYGTAGGAHGCGSTFSGKTRVDNNHIFIGITKLKVLTWPQANSDSILGPSGYTKVKALQKMTVRNSFFHGNVTIDFYKYE